MDDNYLKNRSIVITGSSSGIGKALAKGLSRHGAKVGLIARSTDKLQQISSTIKDEGGYASFVGADVTDYDAIKSALQDLNNQLQGIDILINNAGIGQYNGHEMSKEGIDKLVDVNFKGVLYASALSVPYLRESSHGLIVNSSSIEARPPFGMGYLYASTKSAVDRLATFQHPSGLFAANEIAVNSIRIGFVDTPIFGPTPDAIVEKITNRYTQITGLEPADPSDLVPYFGFFASDKGKTADHRVVDMIYMEQARKHLNNNGYDTSDWESIKSQLEKTMNTKALQNIDQNHDLLRFLLNSD